MGGQRSFNNRVLSTLSADKTLDNLTKDLPPSPDTVPVTKLYAYNFTKQSFEQVGYSCQLCNKVWHTERIGLKHPYVCEAIHGRKRKAK